MDRWLKWLIAAACCVVIVGGAYYAWSEFQMSQERERLRQIAQEQEWRVMCRKMMRDLNSVDSETDWTIGTVAFCVVEGYVQESDFNTDRLAGALKQASGILESLRRSDPPEN